VVESSLRERIAALAESEPAVADDLAVRGAAIAILDGARVEPPRLVLPGARVRAKLERSVPLLDGEAVTIPAEASATFERLAVAWLADRASREPAKMVLNAVRSHRLHAEQLVGEAFAGHDDHLADLVAAIGVPAVLPATLADLAARPLLVALAEQLRPALALARWERGYCPICGAWPIAAVQGSLRCGRCLASWAWPLPGCPYCSTGRLAPIEPLAESDLGAWRVEGCGECRNYLKVAADQRPVGLGAALLDDLETWALDRAALARGFGRPEGPGYRLELLDLEGEGLDDD